MSELRTYLHRYWYRFLGDMNGLPSVAVLGYGVTAVDRRDSDALLQDSIFGGLPLPQPFEVIEDVDVRDLDAGHVRPNMGDPTIRGVWFPRI